MSKLLEALTGVDEGMMRTLLYTAGGDSVIIKNQYGPPSVLFKTEELVGTLIGFFNKKEKLGIGIIIEVLDHSTIYDTINLSVLLGEEIIELRVKSVAKHGSLWITNVERLPYAQFLKEEP